MRGRCSADWTLWPKSGIPARAACKPVRLSVRRKGGRKLRPLWGVAAAAAVVLGVFFYAEYLRKPYCYIDGVAIYDKEAAMQATVYLQGLSDFGDQVRMVDELIINE